MCIHIHVHTHTCAYTYVCIHIHVHKHTCAYTYMCIHIRVHTHTCAYTYVCIHIHVHIHTCAYTYMCIHIRVHTHTCAYTSRISTDFCVHVNRIKDVWQSKVLPLTGNVFSKYSRTPFIRKLVIRIPNYPDRLGSSDKFVDNSPKLKCLEMTGYLIKYYKVLWLIELHIRRGRKV